MQSTSENLETLSINELYVIAMDLQRQEAEEIIHQYECDWISRRTPAWGEC